MIKVSECPPGEGGEEWGFHALLMCSCLVQMSCEPVLPSRREVCDFAGETSRKHMQSLSTADVSQSHVWLGLKPEGEQCLEDRRFPPPGGRGEGRAPAGLQRREAAEAQGARSQRGGLQAGRRVELLGQEGEGPSERLCRGRPVLSGKNRSNGDASLRYLC